MITLAQGMRQLAAGIGVRVRSRLGTALLVGAAMSMGVSASALASIPGAHGMINACIGPSGRLRVIDSAEACKPNETPLNWNQTGPQGPPGISGYEQKTRQIFVNGGAVANDTVLCSAGKKVLGGSFEIETPDDVKVFSSEPSDGSGNVIDHGWNVLVQNKGSATRQVTVTAICAMVR